MSQIDTENDKNSNIPFFKVFIQFLSQILTDFVDLNVDKRPQGKSISSVGIFEEFVAVF